MPQFSFGSRAKPREALPGGHEGITGLFNEFGAALVGGAVASGLGLPTAPAAPPGPALGVQQQGVFVRDVKPPDPVRQEMAKSDP